MQRVDTATPLASKGLGDCSCENPDVSSQASSIFMPSWLDRLPSFFPHHARSANAKSEAGSKCKNSDARHIKLASGEAVPIPIEILAKGVTPGNRKIALESNLRWNDRGCSYSATIVTPQDLTVGIFGQSDILTALGIPSLLLLPGFLIMGMVAVMWKAGVRFGSATVEFPYQLKSPEFWLFAVSLSFLAVLTGRYVFDRPYLNIYGLADLMWLWFLSVLLGGLVFGSSDLLPPLPQGNPLVGRAIQTRSR
jgi:hypothetical protein